MDNSDQKRIFFVTSSSRTSSVDDRATQPIAVNGNHRPSPSPSLGGSIAINIPANHGGDHEGLAGTLFESEVIE